MPSCGNNAEDNLKAPQPTNDPEDMANIIVWSTSPLSVIWRNINVKYVPYIYDCCKCGLVHTKWLQRMIHPMPLLNSKLESNAKYGNGITENQLNRLLS